MRWTIGGDKIDVEYDVGTNTAALPSVNALFHSIVSTHSHLATIDIIDYYLGAILPSPESVRIDVSSISLPTLTKCMCDVSLSLVVVVIVLHFTKI